VRGLRGAPCGSSSGSNSLRDRIGTRMIYAFRWRRREQRLGTLSGGVGPFRFGMTRDDVTRVRDCHPYSPVAITGGLECPHYRFDDREMNISLLFGGEGLRRIQLWYYEGESNVEAREAIGRVVGFLQRTTGGATLTARPDVPVTAEGIIGALDSASPSLDRQIVQLEISAPSDGTTVWFARVGRHEHGYLVMLFAEAAGR
jgi:hypothetical protein